MVPFDRTIKPLIDAQLQHKPSIHSELTEQMPQIQTNVLFFFNHLHFSAVVANNTSSQQTCCFVCKCAKLPRVLVLLSFQVTPVFT